MEGLVRTIWARRVAFLLVFVAVVSAFVAYAYLATPTYRVAVKLMPRQGDVTASGLQSLLGQFGGIASAVGLNAPGSGDEQEAMAWLRTRAFADRFMRQNGVMPIIFSKLWDSERGAWRRDIERQPTPDDAWDVFDKRVRTLSQDQKTRVVTLEVRWKDPEIAARWANAIVAQANQELRMRALAESDATMSSLESQLPGAKSIELQQSIYRLMELQLKKKILAQTRPDYAFAVLDPAVPPDIRHFESPRRILLVAVSLPIAFLFASAFVVATSFFSQFRAGVRPQ